MNVENLKSFPTQDYFSGGDLKEASLSLCVDSPHHLPYWLITVFFSS